jgi:dTDP-4-dehydrorhamnose reductase
MRILVTGSNGLLGQKLVDLISSGNDYLIATAKSSLVVDLSKGEFHLLDVTDVSTLEKVVAQTQPDVIIHTAAMTQVDHCETEQEKCWLNNVEAVENLVKACEKFSVRLIHLSTDFIFDGTHGPLGETEKPNPLSFYGKSKLAAEELIQKSKIGPYSGLF